MLKQATTRPQRVFNQFHAARKPANLRECASLVVDGLGNIRGCGTAAEDIFGANQSRLIGQRISRFIGALFREECSPSYNARYLAHLGADTTWREFQATDARGRMFGVEIIVSPVVADGRDVFVLTLRRPGAAP